MTHIVNVSQSDYRLKVQSGGTITLDVGVSPGVVVVTGDLEVRGITTTIESTVTTIQDNILQLNYGQTGNGVSAVLDYTSGIQIGRGDNQSTYPDAQLVFDEQVDHYDSLTLTTIPGTFVFRYYNNETQTAGGLSGIQVASVGTASGTDLVFDMQNSLNIIKIANSTGYESRVLADNDVPNKKYVNDYVAATGGYADVDNFHYLLAPYQTRGQAYNNRIQFTVMSALRAQIDTTGLNVDDINLYQNLIKTTAASTQNLTLSSDNTMSDGIRYVKVDDRLALSNQALLSNTDVDATLTKIYAGDTAGAGKTGLYFLNKRTGEPGQAINETVNDELVAKNRAILFSMLF